MSNQKQEKDHGKAIENCPPKVQAGKNIRGRGITLPAGGTGGPGSSGTIRTGYGSLRP